MAQALVLHQISVKFRISLRALLVLGLLASSMTFGIEGRAIADTSAYELYCSKTHVGHLVMNGVVTTGAISPSDPAVGTKFTLVNLQTTIPIPVVLVNEMAALGDTTVSGEIRLSLYVSGAQPVTDRKKASFSSPITTPIEKPLSVSAPSSPVVMGPFNANKSSVVVTEDDSVAVTIHVTPGSSAMKADCLTYPNDSSPSGITTVGPSGLPVAPVIATSS